MQRYWKTKACTYAEAYPIRTGLWSILSYDLGLGVRGSGFKGLGHKGLGFRVYEPREESQGNRNSSY